MAESKRQQPSGSSQVILFIPSKDREGHEVDQVYWVDEKCYWSALSRKLSHPVKVCGVMTYAVDSFFLRLL